MRIALAGGSVPEAGGGGSLYMYIYFFFILPLFSLLSFYIP